MIAAEEYEHLASFYARHHRRRAEAAGVPWDALLAAAWAGVEDAVKSYDPSLRRSFASWAASPIRRRIAACLAGRAAGMPATASTGRTGPFPGKRR